MVKDDRRKGTILWVVRERSGNIYLYFNKPKYNKDTGYFYTAPKEFQGTICGENFETTIVRVGEVKKCKVLVSNEETQGKSNCYLPKYKFIPESFKEKYITITKVL